MRKRPPTEAALLGWAFVFLCQVGQKIRQRLLSCKLSGRVGLETICGHLNAQRLALAAYFPTPPFGTLTCPRSDDVIVVGIDRQTAILDPTAAPQPTVV